MRPSLILGSGHRTIGLNTKYGSLEDPRLDGNIFSIMDGRGKTLGSCKKILKIMGPSILLAGTNEIITKSKKGIIVYMRTESALMGFDEGEVDNRNTNIYVSKGDLKILGKDLINTNDLPIDWTPKQSIFIEQDGKREFGNKLLIKGMCEIVYGLEYYHELGGKVRIQTDADVEFVPGEF